MSDAEYDRAIFRDAAWQSRKLAKSELSVMFETIVNNMFGEIEDVISQHQEYPSDYAADDLRAALNNLERLEVRWWPPVSRAVASCLAWHRANTGLYIVGRIGGCGDQVSFVAQSEILQRMLADAFDPAPVAAAHVSMGMTDAGIRCESIGVGWLNPARQPEITIIRHIAQEWREGWAELLRWRQ